MADNSVMVDVKEIYQTNGAVCSQKIGQALSRFKSKHGKAPVNAAKRMRNSRPKTLYGAVKRVTQKISAYKDISNLFACRFREGMKHKFITFLSYMLPKKKMLPMSCIDQSCSVLESSSFSSYVGLTDSRNIASTVVET